MCRNIPVVEDTIQEGQKSQKKTRKEGGVRVGVGVTKQERKQGEWGERGRKKKNRRGEGRGGEEGGR